MELMACVVLLLIFFALLGASLLKARRVGQSIRCVENLKAVGVAMRLYSNDHTGRFPPLETSGVDGKGAGKQWDVVLMDYLGFPKTSSGAFATTGGATTVYLCPSATPWPGTYPGQRSIAQVRQLSYGYNRRIADNSSNTGYAQMIQTPSSIPLVGDMEVPGYSNLSYFTFGGNTNAIWIGPTAANSKAVSYRHAGAANLCFADGRVSPRKPVGSLPSVTPSDYYPRGIRWLNGDALTVE